MTLSYSVRLDGPLIRCRIGTDKPSTAPVFCFSLMATPKVVSGGILLSTLGGYAEVALPDLAPGQPHEVVLRYATASFTPVNRAWLPLGPYLRTSDGPVALPFENAGPAPGPAPRDPGPMMGLGLLPPPSDFAAAAGTCDLTKGIAGDHPALAEVVALADRAGLNAPSFAAQSGIPLTIEFDATLPPEGYQLKISPTGLQLATPDETGAFYGIVTLLHLARLHGAKVPCGTLTDAPRFIWRGQHLDCARHYYRPETIMRLLDLMALYKLNRFHWHFADDEAFRLQVDCLPDLWQKTAFRGEGELIPGVFGGGIRAGGSYSKMTAKDIIAHARRLHIEVLPEIEVPAHALALNRAIPGLRDPADNGAEQSVQDYRDNTINPAMPKIWEVTTALAEEVADLFPFAHLHLGCDELPHDTWSGSPAVTALKAREGLDTTDDVQGWTMERLASHLRARGKIPAAWEEATRGSNGGIGNGAILFSWTGQGPGIEAARRGHPVVMCPAQNVYLDMAHTGDSSDWGAAWAAFVGLEDTVNWSPVPKSAPDIAANVIGIQGTYWSEFTTDDDQIWPMLLPRLLGVASKAWQREESLTGPDLRALARQYAFRMAGNWPWHTAAL